MPLKLTLSTILFAGILVSLPTLAQETTSDKEKGFGGSLRPATVIPNFTVESPEDDAAYEERQIIQHLNGLSRALNDFAAAYKGGQVDLKKVKAVRKAIQDLEKSEWFRPQKAK